jgi:hypothetical protein
MSMAAFDCRVSATPFSHPTVSGRYMMRRHSPSSYVMVRSNAMIGSIRW